VRKEDADLSEGPVLVTIEYSVNPQREAEFVEAIQQYSRIRRRDGAYRWGVYRDTETPEVYVETFLTHTWAEHLRQHERQTQADGELEQRLRSYLTRDPVVHHLIYAHAKEN
jgi:hypothetical protein